MNNLLNNFKNRFPEFENTDDELIGAVLKEAESEINPNLWGKLLFDIALFYLTAHKLSISPMGESVRLDGVQEKSVYQLEYERLCRFVSMGAQVI